MLYIILINNKNVYYIEAAQMNLKYLFMTEKE